MATLITDGMRTKLALRGAARAPERGDDRAVPGLDTLGCRPGQILGVSRAAKACIDVGGAMLLLLALSPLMLTLAALIRLDGGPALFAHERLGARGRSFRCLKFRTMLRNADEVLRDALARDPKVAAEWILHRKLRHDPRVTRVGRFLRSTSLDELPQLINVLRQDMSLVGPRPIVRQEVDRYADAISHYYAVRPGITGLWQVSGRSDVSYDQRVQFDSWYVRNWTLWLDVAILGRTLPVVLRRQGAR